MSDTLAPSGQSADDPRPLIAHVVFRFDFGGLENGVANLVNALPEFRHAIVALTEATEFRARIRRPDVVFVSVGKKPGKDFGAYRRLYGILRDLRPAIVHTRNLGTLDCALVAAAARVRVRIHGEHGWDVHDPEGTRRRYRFLRRFVGLFIHRFVAVSRDLEQWLVQKVHVSARKVQHICNGVDTERFSGAAAAVRAVLPAARFPPGCIVLGSITRFSEIKDPLNLVRAFIALRERFAAGGPELRLLMAGDGSLRAAAEQLLAAAGHSHAAWLPGSRDDVPELLAAMHLFVLGSLREGISNTVLEAMASGLAVVASATGGNLELIEPDINGTLVPPGDSIALSEAIARYVSNPLLREQHGRAARERAVRHYSLTRMVEEYRQLYRSVTPRILASTPNTGAIA